MDLYFSRTAHTLVMNRQQQQQAFPLTFRKQLELAYKDIDLLPLNMDVVQVIMKFHEEKEYAFYRTAMTFQMSNIIRQRRMFHSAMTWYLPRDPARYVVRLPWAPPLMATRLIYSDVSANRYIMIHQVADAVPIMYVLR